jgi:hypothetical protein
MRHARVLLILIFIVPVCAMAQRWEVGVFAGASNYLGDLAPNLVWKETHPAFGVDIQHNVSGYFSYSLNVNVGEISGNDANTPSLAPRGLNFKSNLLEFGPQFQFNFLKYGLRRGSKRFSPYIFTGFSFVHFDPVASFQGTTYHLQLLSTEGQGIVQGAPNPYSLWTYAIPLGGGFKVNLSNRFNLHIHAAYMTTFTDYLDDVSGKYADREVLESKKGQAAAYLSDPTGIGKTNHQRGSADTKDWYILSGFTLSYILQPPICYKF